MRMSQYSISTSSRQSGRRFCMAAKAMSDHSFRISGRSPISGSSWASESS